LNREKIVVRKAVILAIALALAPLPAFAAPGDMSVASFLERADRLEAMGMRAMFSGDVAVLKSEAQGASAAYRARLAADRAARRPPHSCVTSGTKINSDALMTHLRSYPAAQRQTTSMKMAMADMFAKTYPCPRAR
jgi:hypothetical protein